MPLQYTAADASGWLAICAGTRILMIGAAVDDDALAALWRDIGSLEGTQRVLELLTRDGLSATPPFALVETGEHGRAIVRGGVTVTVTGPGGMESLTGAGVTTWTERLVGSISALTISIDGAMGVRSMPLVSGIVIAAAIDWTAASAAMTRSAASADRGESQLVEETVVAPPRQRKTADRPDPEATVTDIRHEEAPERSTALENPESGYDYLFGDTVFRTVAGAAIVEQQAEEPESEPARRPAADPESEPESSEIGDHDGMTVMTSEVAQLKNGLAERKSARGEAAPAEADALPPTIVLSLPNGVRQTLSQPMLVGRAPSVSQVSGGMMPTLVTIGNSDQDISRTHARFALEGGTVVVTDLHSRNGTTVTLPGKASERLRPGEPTCVLPGTIVDFGGGLTVTVDED